MIAERIRYLHFSQRAEKVYPPWVKFIITIDDEPESRDKWPREFETFLTMLTTERKVSASPRNQALRAISFSYREVALPIWAWKRLTNLT